MYIWCLFNVTRLIKETIKKSCWESKPRNVFGNPNNFNLYVSFFVWISTNQLIFQNRQVMQVMPGMRHNLKNILRLFRKLLFKYQFCNFRYTIHFKSLPYPIEIAVAWFSDTNIFLSGNLVLKFVRNDIILWISHMCEAGCCGI